MHNFLSKTIYDKDTKREEVEEMAQIRKQEEVYI